MSGLIVEIVEGSQAGRQIPLDGPIELGREQSLRMVLDDAQTSRRHARLTPYGASAVVEDLGSTNGTFVNDQPLHGPRELLPGDRVRVGLTVLMLRSPQQVAEQPSAIRPVPQVTQVGREVLAPAPPEQLPLQPPAASGFRQPQTPPAYVPPAAVGDPDAESDYAALARLVDRRVKGQNHVAAFAVLSVAGLAVLIYFGVR